jgi:hypothetical protein
MVGLVETICRITISTHPVKKKYVEKQHISSRHIPHSIIIPQRDKAIFLEDTAGRRHRATTKKERLK